MEPGDSSPHSHKPIIIIIIIITIIIITTGSGLDDWHFFTITIIYNSSQSMAA
jgi:hypothetical protein